MFSECGRPFSNMAIFEKVMFCDQPLGVGKRLTNNQYKGNFDLFHLFYVFRFAL